MNTLQIQEALKDRGFNPGRLDGIMGPKTEQAIVNFKVAHGLKARPYLGPITLARLFGTTPVAADTKHRPKALEVPWINEMMKHYRMHEEDPALAAWLRSDGGTVGNPDDIPWCGDAVHTSIRNALPGETFNGRVKANPYLARNWVDFGVELKGLRYGAILSMWRKKPSSMYGHVAFAVGYDPKRKRIRILGGNQTDRVTKTWVSEKRLRQHGIRAPKTYSDLPPIPIMNSAGQVISTNEA